RLDHTYGDLGNPEGLRQVDPQGMRVLGRVPDGVEVLVGVVLRYDAAGLERCAGDPVRLDDAADDAVRFRECSVGIAGDEIAADDHVVRPARLDPRRIRFERLLRIDNRGQLLVIDVDVVERLVRRVLVLGDHSRDGLADEPYALRG